MPIKYTWTNFSGGEWSEELSARVDVAKYQTACACLLNYIVRPQGGVTRRPGTKFVVETKNSAWKSRLVPMSVSANKHYVIEMGCGYMRFLSSSAQLKDAANTPVEVSTPYAEADLFAVHRVPSVDIIYFLNRAYQTRKLERYSDTCFRFRAINFTAPPTFEAGHYPNARLKVSATSGDGVTIDTRDGSPAFTYADCAREIVVFGGCNTGARAGIARFDCPGSVLANICSAWLNTNLADCGHWYLTGSPQTSVTPSDNAPVGKQVTLTLSQGGWRGNISYAADFPAQTHTISDCGRYALINGGSFEIIRVTSCLIANAVIRGEATGVTRAEPGAWTLECSLWSDRSGWAETGAFLDSRLYLGSCHRFAASKVSDYENFAPGTLDDDGLLFAIDSDTLQQIRWLVGLKGLMLGTASGEYLAAGGNDSPITPDNITVKRQTTFGASTVAPLVIGNAILFATRSGRKLREMVEDPNLLSGFVAPDLMLLAQHLMERSTVNGTDPTIVDMAYQQEPDSRVWVVRSDGILLCCTYLRDQNIVAWSRHQTEGAFESVCVIPHPDGNRDQVWLLVKRTINGQTKRYIEYFDDAGVNYPTTNVDCAFTCDRMSASCTVYGLSHLECARVSIVGDGGSFADQYVVSGNVTLDSAVDKVEVGLPYESSLVTMRPEIATQQGTSQPTKMRWVKLFVRVVNSIGLILGNSRGTEVIPWRSTCDLMDCAPSLYTGTKELVRLGWDCAKVSVIQKEPLPSTVLSISGEIELGD